MQRDSGSDSLIPFMVRNRDSVLIAGALALCAWWLAQLIDFGYGRDQGIYATAAREMWRGGVPYRDVWDFKPPGIFVIYALARVLGDGVHAIRWIEAGALASVPFAFGWISRSYWDDARPGVIAGAIAIGTYVGLEFWHTGQPESFGAVVLAWAAAFATAGIRRPRARVWLAAGVLYGVAALLKPTLGAAGVVSLLLGIHAARSVDRGSWRSAVRTVLLPIAFGTAVPVVGCLGLFAVRGGLVELRSAMFDFVPHYVAFSWQDASVRHVAADTIQQWFWQYSLLNPIGLALFAFLPRLGRQMPAVVHVGGIVLVLIVGVAAQAKLLAYHFGAVLPLTSLLAGWGYWKLWMFLRTRRFGLAGLAAVLLAAYVVSPAPPGLEPFPQREWLRMRAWFNPAQRSAIRDRLYSVADYNARDVRTTVQWLQGHTGTGDRLFIWGFTPEIYVASGRPIASRYVYNLAQRSPWDAAAARSRLMQDLSAAPPGVIVVEYGDRLVRLTGTTKDSAEEIETFPELQHLLKDAYAPAARLGKFGIFARRPGAGTPGRTSHPLPE